MSSLVPEEMDAASYHGEEGIGRVDQCFSLRFGQLAGLDPGSYQSRRLPFERLYGGDGGGVVLARRGDGDGYCRRIAVCPAIVDSVGEGIGTIVVVIREVGKGAIGIEGEGAMSGTADQDGGESIPLCVPIIAEDSGSGDG